MTDNRSGWLEQDVRGELAAFGFFLLLSLALRTQAFPLSVTDWDESLYFLIAKDLRAGFMPYETIFEHKPVGIFLIFAFFQTLLGDRIVAMRVATILAVAVSALLVKAITDLLTSRSLEEGSGRAESTLAESANPIVRRSPGLVAGSLFAVYSTTNWGLAANTEHFFTPFVCGSFLIVIRMMLDPRAEADRRGVAVRTISAGLLMGLALQVKYLVVWETIVIGLAILALDHVRGSATGLALVAKRSISRVALYAVAVLAPTVVVVIAFWSRGMWESWLYSNITANLAYGKMAGFAPTMWIDAMTNQVVSQGVLWLAALLAAVYVARGRGPRRIKAAVLLLFLWWVAGLIGASSTGLFFPHYFLQPLPPACVLSAWLALVILPMVLRWPSTGGGPRLARWALVALVLTQAIAIAGGALWKGAKAVDAWVRSGVEWPNDEPVRVAAAVREGISDGDVIYVVDYHLIVYHLAGARWPTRYIFPTHLTTRQAYMLDIDPVEELQRIFALQPSLVVRKRRSRGSAALLDVVQQGIDEDYVLQVSVGQVDIYRRR